MRAGPKIGRWTCSWSFLAVVAACAVYGFLHDPWWYGLVVLAFIPLCGVLTWASDKIDEMREPEHKTVVRDG